MKHVFKLICTLVCLLIATTLFAQVPQKLNYQGIARDEKGNPLAKQPLNLKLSLLPTHDATLAEYEETQMVTTNEFGLYTLQIGNGTPLIGEMKNVKWETGNKYIRVAIDATGGTNFIDAGTTQLLSVPYAFYADKAGSSGSTTSENQTRASNNYIEKTNGSGVANSSSQIYDNGTNLGIGTTSPVAKFQINQNVAGVQEHLRMQNVSATGAGRFTMYNDAVNSYATFTKYGSNYAGGYAGITSLYPYANLLAFGNNGITANDGKGRFLISSGGNVGISLFKGGTSKLKFHADFLTENVGIGGSADPVSRVHLNNTDDVNMEMRLTNTTTGHTVSDGLTMHENGVDADITNNESGYLSFGTNHIERARIDSLGHVGIGTLAPISKLHISDTIGNDLVLENSSIQSLGSKVGLSLKHSNYYNAAIKVIGTSASSSRLGLFTGNTALESSLIERLTISSSGNIGIGDTSPSYKLRVNGTIFSNYLINSGGSEFGTVGSIMQNYGDSYVDGYFDVDGNVDFSGNLHVAGNTTNDGNISVGGTASVGGEMTVSAGNGIVKSNSGTQLRMGFSSGHIQGTWGSNSTGSATFNITPFTGNNSNIRVTIAQFQPDAGSNLDYTHLTFTPHDVNATTDQCTITIFNGGSTSATFAGTLYLLCVATD